MVIFFHYFCTFFVGTDNNVEFPVQRNFDETSYLSYKMPNITKHI
mgnify:CR=1 FL=1